jgi:hypothetical protein
MQNLSFKFQISLFLSPRYLFGIGMHRSKNIIFSGIIIIVFLLIYTDCLNYNFSKLKSDYLNYGKAC